jgi:hypothetical protein
VLDRIVEIDEAQEADLPVQNLNDCADPTFIFTIGLGSLDLGILLTDTELRTGFHKSIFTDSFEFFTVIWINRW